MTILKVTLESLRRMLRSKQYTGPGDSDPHIKAQAQLMSSDCYPLSLFIQWLDGNEDAVEFLRRSGISWNGEASLSVVEAVRATPDASLERQVAHAPPAVTPGLPGIPGMLSDEPTLHASGCQPFSAKVGTGQFELVRLLDVISDRLKVQVIDAAGVPTRKPGSISIIQLCQVAKGDYDRVSKFWKASPGRLEYFYEQPAKPGIAPQSREDSPAEQETWNLSSRLGKVSGLGDEVKFG